MKKALILLVITLIALTTAITQAKPVNWAGAANGATASSNGDFISDKEKHPASGAIDGTKDMSRYSNGGVWLSSLHVSKKTPAIWQVVFQEARKINRVVIYHLPQGANQLVDFELEYKKPGSQEFIKVVPSISNWSNPVLGNSYSISTLIFEPVETKSLRLVITKASPDSILWNKYGQAYIVEFEAYYIDTDAEKRKFRQAQLKFREVGSLASAWSKKRQQKEQTRRRKQTVEDKDVMEADCLAWVRKEKIRTSHTGLGAQHLSELMPKLARLGFNSIDPGGRRFASQPEKWEKELTVVNQLAQKLDMKISPWIAWYWYANDKDFPDRNCMPDLTAEGDYRRAVDFRGKKMELAPCPLSGAFWRDIQANVSQVVQWSRQFDRIWGTCIDFEFYGTGSSRQPSDWYGYDFCFCDHCFGLFLQRIGSKLTARDVAPKDRFVRLKEVGAGQAYYEMLADEVRNRAEKVRNAAHTINPEFVLQFYGVPILPDPQATEKLSANYLWNGWFGYGLAQGLGTKRLPCIYKPLDASDPRPGRWTPTARMSRSDVEGEYWKFVETGKTFDREYKELGLNVVHVAGLVICNESPSKDMAGAMRSSLADGNGFWFNEGWMLLAFRKPDHPMPGWWKGQETIESYWKMLDDVLKDYPRFLSEKP